MSTLFDVVHPRMDVRTGELTESQFAAGLEDVAAGKAADVYGDAVTFFEGTYPSSGLKTLLNEALGRLSGNKPASASVLRLETSFGGGKTHNLIALYHAARGRLAPTQAAEFMDPDLLPDEPPTRLGCSWVPRLVRRASPRSRASPRGRCGATWRCRSAARTHTSLSEPTTRL